VRGLVVRRDRKRNAGILDASPRLLRELRPVLPEERIVVLERHHDAPERIVVMQPERVSRPIEPLAFLL
jgi:hypothetical protein